MNELALNLEPFISDNRKTVSVTQNIIELYSNTRI